MSQWIPTEVMLPPVGVPVWTFHYAVTLPKERSFIFLSARSKSGWRGCHDDCWWDGEQWQTHNGHADMDCPPLYWMHLPQPPSDFTNGGAA